MTISEADRIAIADAVAAKLAEDEETSGEPVWLKTAGQVVGLVAGIVALGYFLGAGVIATRLFVDRFEPDEVVGVIGELPKTFVTTLGFVEGFGVALAIGLVLGALAAAFKWPKAATPAGRPLALFWLFALGCFVYVVVQEDEWRTGMWILMPSLLLSIAIAYVGVKTLLSSNAVDSTRVLNRAGAAAALVTAVGIPLCVMCGPIVGFPSARVCLQTTATPLTGSLVVDGDDRVVLIRQSKEEREQTTSRTIDSIPTDLVARLDYGDLAELAPCDAPPTGP